MRSTHNGVTRRIRMNRVVNAGRVVADVGVLCVERKSVRRRKGSRRRLQRLVNSRNVSTISSSDLCCRRFPLSLGSLLWPCFSPVWVVDESGEYLLEYIPIISPATKIIGPAHSMILLPYNTMAQKPATIRKLSHGSPVLHDKRPTNLFRGNKKGCEYARALVTCGGVAISRGDFLCTMMVDLCRELIDEPDRFCGEKAATVGGFGSYVGCDADEPSSDLYVEEGPIDVSQGVSIEMRVRKRYTSHKPALASCPKGLPIAAINWCQLGIHYHVACLAQDMLYLIRRQAAYQLKEEERLKTCWVEEDAWSWQKTPSKKKHVQADISMRTPLRISPLG